MYHDADLQLCIGECTSITMHMLHSHTYSQYSVDCCASADRRTAYYYAMRGSTYSWYLSY